MKVRVTLKFDPDDLALIREELEGEGYKNPNRQDIVNWIGKVIDGRILRISDEKIRRERAEKS